mgnify:CR=1 FL=1
MRNRRGSKRSTINGAGTTATGSRNGKFAVEKQPPNMGGNRIQASTLCLSKWCRRGIAGIAIFTQNCDISVQIRQLCIFLPQFGHNISTLRKHFESTSKGKVSKQKTAYTKGSKGITWLIYLLRKPFHFSARVERKNIFTI